MEKCPRCGKEVSEETQACPHCGITLPQLDVTQISDETIEGMPQAPTEEAALKPGSVLGARYEILEVIGKGGMGWVYKAKDREIDRIVALKVVRQDLARDETMIKRFKDEIILARKVTHKNVLRIYDIAEAEGLKFISMPFIEGKDLKTIILEQGKLGIDEALRIATQVLEALKAAHEAGVIHRDLKPQNIMVDKDGTVCVADFGIAKSAEAGGMTVTGQIVGTPEYMSPEQAEGKRVDFRTDLYSFGLVLYEMLTGEVPFRADSIISTLMLRLRETPKAPSAVNPAVPKWLDRLVLRALERDPASRYQTADEILEDIRSQTVRRKVRLGKRMLALVGVAGLVAAVGILFIGRKPKIVLEEKRTYVAVLPFENITGQADLDWLTTGIADNLTADLAQSKFFRVMSPARLHQIAAEAGIDVAEISTPEALTKLAKATDVDAVILGSFVKAGDEIRITMKVEDPETQELIGTKIVQAKEDAVLDLIDQLTRETKYIFHLSQEDIDKDLDQALGLQRTRSVTAASEFAKGIELTYVGSYLEAAQAFEAAIEADPDFAMAYAKASEAYRNLGYDAKAESLSLIAVDKVVKFIDRVPPADRTFILANHAEITYNTEQAIESYKEFIKAYPDDPEGYYKLALTYETISEWGEAARNLKRALELDSKFVAARFELAKVLIRNEELDEALDELNRSLEAYRSMGNREGEAAVLNAIGVVYRHRNDFEKAISYFEESIRIKEELGDKRGVAASLGNLGLVYKIMGRQDDALEAYKRSLEIKREIGDKIGVSTALNKIAQIYQNSGRYEEALSYYERSYETRKEIGAKHLMAASLSDMAGLYSLMGHYKEALRLDSLALALRVEIGDQRGESHSLRNVAESLIARARFEEAAAKLRRAVEVDTELGDVRLLAADSLGLGQHCLARGKLDSAIIYFRGAFRVNQRLNAKRSLVIAQALLGEAYARKWEFAKAMYHLDSAYALASRIGEKESAIEALLGKALLYQEIGYEAGYDSVMQDLDEFGESDMGFESACRLKLTRLRGMCLSGLDKDARALSEHLGQILGTELMRCTVESKLLGADILAHTGSPTDARAELSVALDLARRYSLGDLAAVALRRMAELELEAGDLQAASSHADKALRLTASLGLPKYEYLVLAARIKEDLQDLEAGRDLYIKALDEVANAYANCPPRLRIWFIKSKAVENYINHLRAFATGSEMARKLEAYKSGFNLK